jgi:alkylation response protein AidB-like acyl-CoA dehydrogenase
MPDDNENLIAESARRLFGAFSIETRREQWHGRWLSEAFAEMREAGMLELARMPEADREAAAYLAALAIELGRSGIATPFITSAIAASYCLSRAGRAVEAEACLNGTAIEAVAFSEPAGSINGALNPQTLFVDGRLIGVKNSIPFAEAASHLLVSARTSSGKTCVLRVPSDFPGVTRITLEGSTGEPLSELHLDCALGEDAVLFEGAECNEVVKAALTRIYYAQSAILVGGAQRALEIVTAHVIERHQFGQALGMFQAVQHHIANSRMQLDAARLMVFELGWRIGSNHDELLAWAAETKAWISEATGEIMRRAHELQGGISVTDEHETMLLSRRNLGESVQWGSSSELLSLAYPLRKIPPSVQPLFEPLP